MDEQKELELGELDQFLSGIDLEEAGQETNVAVSTQQPETAPDDVNALKERIAQLESQIADAQVAIQFYKQFTDPQLIPMAVQNLVDWAQSAGYYNPPAPQRRSSNDFLFDEEDEMENTGRSDEITSKVSQLESQIQSFILEQRRKQAVEQASQLIMGWAQQQGMQIDNKTVEGIINEASTIVRPDMDNSTVEKILKMVYTQKMLEARQRGNASADSERPLRRAPQLNVNTAPSSEDDLLSKIDRAVLEYLS